MKINNLRAPDLDDLIRPCQNYLEVKNEKNIKKLTAIFDMMCRLEKQGDDEYRSIWVTAKRGTIEDFGDYEEFLEEGEVGNKDEFKDLWLCFYPDEVKWYKFAISTYEEVLYFFIDSKLTLQCKADDASSDADYHFITKLIEWLSQATEETIAQVKENKYNTFINENLPYKKRIGRILRKDYWDIFPDYTKDFTNTITPEIIETLEKIKDQSLTNSISYLPEISSGDFFRFCEIGYDANQYFDQSDKTLTPKEKYTSMADGRDCGLREIDEKSSKEFQKWHENKSNCGGHPWEICRGGNSTHISLYVCQEEKGWYLLLRGSSRSRVIETIKIAIALYKQDIPFVLEKAEEIYRMAHGVDYIGIVPENVIPVYCHSFFPEEDKIIDFMNLGDEKSDEIIDQAFWYPLDEVRLIK